MRKQAQFVSLSIACVLVAAFATAQAMQSAQVPFSLAVSTPTSTVKVGSELKLDIALTSTSDKPFLFNLHVKLDIRDSEGKAVSEIKPSEETAKRPEAKEGEARGRGGSGPGTEIESGKTMHFEEIVNREFDFSKSGTYTVQATQEFSNNVTVKSNTLMITVTP